MDEELAIAEAAQPHGSPPIGRAMYCANYRFVDDGCTSCSRKGDSIADLTSKNADLLKSNAELKQEVVRMQSEVEAQKRNTRFGRQFGF